VRADEPPDDLRKGEEGRLLLLLEAVGKFLRAVADHGATYSKAPARGKGSPLLSFHIYAGGRQ
jgi:hypothetical protein